MATMVAGFMTNLLPRPAAIEPSVWTVWGGSFGADVQGHAPDRVWTPTPSYRAFAASTYAMAGMEARNLIGAGAENYLFELETSAGAAVASLRCNSSGHLAVYNGASTQIAITTGSPPLGAASQFYTVEFAWDNTVAAGQCEVRVDGMRILALTSSSLAFGGSQSQGSLGAFSPAVSGAVIERVMLADVASGATPVIYWYYQKNGSSLWTSVPTGATFALVSDFVGSRKKAWLFPNAVGNYTMPTIGSGTQTSNWREDDDTTDTGYLAKIADSGSGTDSDTTYIKNQVTGTYASADRISHNFTNLPAAATTVGFLQRTVIARHESALSDTIKTGIRVAGADTDDVATTLSPTYGAGSSPAFGLSTYYARMPDGTTVWTPTTVNALEGIIAQGAVV